MDSTEERSQDANPNRLGVTVGLFRDQQQAEAADAELRQAGFSDAQVDIEKGAAPMRRLNGGLLGNLGRLLGIERGKYQDFVDDATRLRLTEDQAFWLEQQFRDGDEVVVVDAGERAEQAYAILQRHGAEMHVGSGRATVPPANAPGADRTPGEWLGHERH